MAKAAQRSAPSSGSPWPDGKPVNPGPETISTAPSTADERQCKAEGETCVEPRTGRDMVCARHAVSHTRDGKRRVTGSKMAGLVAASTMVQRVNGIKKG